MNSELQNLIVADRSKIHAHAQDAVGNLSQILPAQSDASAQSDHTGAAGNFADSFRQAIHNVDRMEQEATQKMADVDSGRSDDLVGAMLSSQEASLSFSMLMQVRNKVMGAMDELIKLPV